MIFPTRRPLVIVAVALAVALVAGCGRTTPPSDEHVSLDLDQALALAGERGVPVLVDFYSPT